MALNGAQNGIHASGPRAGAGSAPDNHAAFIWGVADLLRGDYKRSEYGKVILPLTVLRRLDCVLAPTKPRVLERHERLRGKLKNVGPVLTGITGVQFYNVSELDLERVLDDPPNVADSLRAYVAGFSPEVREVFEKFDLDAQVTRLDSANLLYLVLGRFAEIDLGPKAVSNTEMGYVYEELIRRFSELSNETAGEHFTPREVVELMVSLLFVEDDDLLSKPGTVKTMLDPSCDTGGMLSVSESYLRERNPKARLEVYGQELNAETYAVCRSDMMLKDPEHAAHIAHGNSFSQDGHPTSPTEWNTHPITPRSPRTASYHARPSKRWPQLLHRSLVVLCSKSDGLTWPPAPSLRTTRTACRSPSASPPRGG
jgi:type I restriction enzyme M protein